MKVPDDKFPNLQMQWLWAQALKQVFLSGKVSKFQANFKQRKILTRAEQIKRLNINLDYFRTLVCSNWWTR